MKGELRATHAIIRRKTIKLLPPIHFALVGMLKDGAMQETSDYDEGLPAMPAHEQKDHKKYLE
jgi:hypothetical protein